MEIIEKSFGEEQVMEAEEWAALWGSDSWGPMGPDGAYFYNFACVERTPKFLSEFIQVINRQIKEIEIRVAQPKNDYGWTKDDLENMGLLHDYVEELLEEAERLSSD